MLDDYCVIDTETTGLSPYSNEIIEIGILKVRQGQITDRYAQLVMPRQSINSFITQLTGITNEMVAGMPRIGDVKQEVLDFLGNDLIVGHNTSFDIRFLNAGFQNAIRNEYTDTVHYARKLYPELRHHRLTDLAQYLHLSNNEHRALADCITTHQLYEVMKAALAK